MSAYIVVIGSTGAAQGFDDIKEARQYVINHIGACNASGVADFAQIMSGDRPITWVSHYFSEAFVPY